MNAELELKIKNTYPEMFTNMLRPGFEFGNGWYDLFKDLCEELSHYNTSIVLAKEKWGGLRIFIEVDADNYDLVSDIISKAEANSYKICEGCGLPGTVREGGYVRTLCEDCHSKSTQKRFDRYA